MSSFVVVLVHGYVRSLFTNCGFWVRHFHQIKKYNSFWGSESNTINPRGKCVRIFDWVRFGKVDHEYDIDLSWHKHMLYAFRYLEIYHIRAKAKWAPFRRRHI